jgi:hypothetical protein
MSVKDRETVRTRSAFASRDRPKLAFTNLPMLTAIRLSGQGRASWKCMSIKRLFNAPDDEYVAILNNDVKAGSRRVKPAIEGSVGVIPKDTERAKTEMADFDAAMDMFNNGTTWDRDPTKTVDLAYFTHSLLIRLKGISRTTYNGATTYVLNGTNMIPVQTSKASHFLILGFDDENDYAARIRRNSKLEPQSPSVKITSIPKLISKS